MLRRRGLLACWLASFSAGLVPWLHTATFRYVYDDRWTLVDNPWLNESLPRVWHLLVHGDAARLNVPDATRPAMVVSMWVDHLHGSPALAHLHSALLHGLVVAAAFLLAFATLRRRLPALAVAALFAFSTAQVEATAVINYREDLLAALGLLSALTILVWPRARNPGLDVVAGAALMLALLAKENAIAVLLLVPLFAAAARSPRRWLLHRERLLTIFGTVVLVWGLWRWSLTLAGPDLPRAEHHEPLEQGLRLARYLVWVLRASALPSLPTPLHDTTELPSGLWALLASAVVMGIIVLLVTRRPLPRAMGVGLAWVMLAALPTSPLVGPANEQADRYLLLSSFGAALAWVSLGRRVLPAAWRSRALGVAVFALTVTSFVSSLTYRTERTLFDVAVERAPGLGQAWAGLAYVLRSEDDLARAGEVADMACRLAPQSVRVRLTRAYVLLEVGDDERARADLHWVEANGGSAVPGYRRAVDCLVTPLAGRRSCLRQHVSPL